MQKCLASTYVYWEDGAFEMLPPDKRVEKVTTTIIICLEMHKHVGVSCKYFNLKTLLAFWSWSWSLVEREERGLTWCASSDSFTLPFVVCFFSNILLRLGSTGCYKVRRWYMCLYSWFAETGSALAQRCKLVSAVGMSQILFANQV